MPFERFGFSLVSIGGDRAATIFAFLSTMSAYCSIFEALVDSSAAVLAAYFCFGSDPLALVDAASVPIGGRSKTTEHFFGLLLLSFGVLTRFLPLTDIALI